MKNFYSFLVEAEDKATEEPKRISDDAVTVFGRHQPPHLGHKLTLDHASRLAKNIGDKAPGDQHFYTSRSMDPKKNPLPFQLKLNFLQRMFPEHAQKWDPDENVRTILDAATKAHEKGYKNFHFVGGGDRRQPMEDLMRRYNGNLYQFDNIYSHSAGEREDNSDDPIANLSASKLRNLVAKGDLEKFTEGMPTGKHFTAKDIKELFDAVQLYGEKNKQMSNEDVRELYRMGRIFNEGDTVTSDISGLTGQIHRRGANHLICVTENDIMFKCFINQVSYK
jgi:hypothetical protein